MFVGGWNLAAAEVVGELGMATLDLLSGLIDKSLIRQTVGIGDEPRYTMLETIREYALEQLMTAGEAEATHERHAAYFLGLAERAAPEEYGQSPSYWLDGLEVEHANLQSALHASLAGGAHDRTALLCAYLRWFWFNRAHFTVAATWIDRMWAIQQQLAPPVRARFLRECAYIVPGYERHVQGAETSVTLYRELGDQHGEAWALITLSGLTYFMGDGERSRAPAEAVLPLARQFDDQALLTEALSSLGNIRLYDQQLEAAQVLFEEGLQRSRDANIPIMIATHLGYLGHVASGQGHYAQAAARYTECAAIRRALGDRRGTAAQLMNEATPALNMGEVGRALELLYESLTVFKEIGWAQGIGWVHLDLIRAASMLGQHRAAARFLGAEEMFRAEVGYAIWPESLPVFERELAETRAALDGDTFATAFAAGRALSLEEATAEALAWLETVQ